MKKKIIAIIVAIVLIIPVSRGWYEFLLDNFFDAELASSTQLKFEKISDTEDLMQQMKRFLRQLSLQALTAL